MTSKTDHPKPLARITKPMVRDNGELREASWDEALTRAADGFSQAINDQDMKHLVSLVVRKAPTR